MPKEKIIFFGPWVGEFGYELPYWIGECRTIRNMYPDYKSVASSFFGRKFIYSFIDEFFPHDKRSNYTSNSSMIFGKEVKIHPLVPEYINRSSIVIQPGKVYRNLKLGGSHGHSQIKESIKFQTRIKMMASNEKIDEIKKIIPENKPVISILSRNIDYCGGIHRWLEEKWVSIINSLIAENFFVISILPYFPSKSCFLEKFSHEGFLNAGIHFKDREDFTELQVAILNLSKIALMTPTGAAHLIYHTETPCLYMLSEENNEYHRLFQEWSRPHKFNLNYLFGNGSTSDISEDTCLKTIKELT